jgi:hypothetical protein
MPPVSAARPSCLMIQPFHPTAPLCLPLPWPNLQAFHPHLSPMQNKPSMVRIRTASTPLVLNYITSPLRVPMGRSPANLTPTPTMAGTSPARRTVNMHPTAPHIHKPNVSLGHPANSWTTFRSSSRYHPRTLRPQHPRSAPCDRMRTYLIPSPMSRLLLLLLPPPALVTLAL